MKEAGFTFEKYHFKADTDGKFKFYKNTRVILYSKIISFRKGHGIFSYTGNKIKCNSISIDCEKGRT